MRFIENRLYILLDRFTIFKFVALYDCLPCRKRTLTIDKSICYKRKAFSFFDIPLIFHESVFKKSISISTLSSIGFELQEKYQ